MFFESLSRDRDDRDVGVAGFGECFSDKGDVIGGAASAAGLRDEDGGFVRVVFARFERVNDLARGEDGWEAGVVVDVLETFVDDGLVGAFDDFEVIALGVEDFGQNSEVDGAHLRRDDGVVIAHLFGEHARSWPCIFEGGDGRRCGVGCGLASVAFVESGDEASDANASRADIAAFVDFECGIDARICLEDFHDLVGRDGIEPAAEAVELYEFDLGLSGGKSSGAIEPRVVCPLIDDAESGARIAAPSDGVFGEDGDVVCGDDVGNAVMYFWIDVIGAACQDDSANAVCFGIGDGARAFFADVVFVGIAFGECGADGAADFDGGGVAEVFDNGI